MIRKLAIATVLVAFAATASASSSQPSSSQECIQILWWTYCLPGSGGSSKPVAAPELDPSAALGALALLAGGLAVMRGRRSKAIEAV